MTTGIWDFGYSYSTAAKQTTNLIVSIISAMVAEQHNFDPKLQHQTPIEVEVIMTTVVVINVPSHAAFTDCSLWHALQLMLILKTEFEYFNCH